MNIALLGGDGLVGWELSRTLLALGRVIAPGRGELDIGESTSIDSFLVRNNIDILVNAAAYTDVDGAESEPQQAETINGSAVATMARCMADRGGLLVHYSTDYVFDGNKSSAYTELDTPAPLGVYARTKLVGEQAIVAAAGRHIILRTSWIHSHRRRNFVRSILRLAKERSQIDVVADQFGAPTGADMLADVTALVIYRLKHAPADGFQGLYHLTASGRTSWWDFARFILREAVAAGASLQCRAENVRPIATAEYRTAAMRPKNSQLDCSRICRDFDLVLPDWRVHARRCVGRIIEREMT